MTDYPFTDEDRARLEAMAGRLHRYTGKQDADADAIDSALAHKLARDYASREEGRR